MTVPENRWLRFALGPVQSFFAQSRRTRDLWSSSFLVSYLSACAVDAFDEAGARVVLPDVADDRLVDAVREVRLGRTVHDPPTIGSVPNQLTVEAADPVPVARAAERRVAAAWARITEAVWERIAPAASHGRETRRIWERQLGSFWQIHWAVGGAEALTRRKAWRGRHREGEPGDKCMLMTGWQELSGFHGATEKKLQDRFWNELRRVLRTYDLGDGEQLCALALVKRLFPSVAVKAIGWELDAVHWPSTPYLAARPWMEDLLVQGGPKVRDDAEAYADLVLEQTPRAHRVEKGADRIISGAPALDQSTFLHLDGSYLFLNDLDYPERTPLTDEEAREDVAQLLAELYAEAAAAGRRRNPSSFHALLQLDGDRLGKLFDESEDPSETSRALARFAREGVALVREHRGLPVYAGGDDLVAFLPLPSALSTTVALAALYESILQPAVESTLRVTTSAALVFAHCRAPLRSIVAEGHRMLEEDAKDANGRGSVAVAVWKASGVTSRWVTTWEQLVPDWPSPGVAEPVGPHRIGLVANQLQDDEVSKSFLYGQRDVFTRLCGHEPWRPGFTVELPDGIAPEALVRAELARARDKNPEDVAGVARELTELMKPGRRADDGKSDNSSSLLVFDPLLLARFLNAESPGGPA